jgi:hypothetical protein
MSRIVKNRYTVDRWRTTRDDGNQEETLQEEVEFQR